MSEHRRRAAPRSGAIDSDVSEHRRRAAPRSGAIGRDVKLRWSLVPAAAVVGTVAFSLLSSVGSREGWSYLGGLLLVVGVFEFGAYNVRFATRYLPNLTLVVALLSYAMTVTALGLALAVSSPRVVDLVAAAIGIFVAVGVWVGTEILHSRVRSEHA
jgi:hypothetical protein